LQSNKAALREPTAAFFESVSDFHARADSVDVRVSGDLAVVHCIVQNGWVDKSGQHSQTSRDTEVFRKEGGKNELPDINCPAFGQLGKGEANPIQQR
jgi:ketosteroid isomerase-like protein